MSTMNLTLAMAGRMLKDELDQISGSPTGWVVDQDNRDALNEVAAWIYRGDFRRGFTLRGPVGTGKSRIVEAAGRVLRKIDGRGIRRIEAVELVNTVAKAKGDRSVLEKYADHMAYPFLWIEDLLTEGNAPSFVKGDEGINCVAELLQVRYKRWEQGLPLTTGFTTNGDNAQLLERYLERCCSRMNHMAFVIPLPGPDRRASSAIPEVQQRMEFAALAEPVPDSEDSVRMNDEPIAPGIQGIVDTVRRNHDARVMERHAAFEKRKAEYLDDMRTRVRRMDLAELHGVITTDAYAEGRSIALNEWANRAPISHEAFCEQLAESERRKAEEQERAA